MELWNAALEFGTNNSAHKIVIVRFWYTYIRKVGHSEYVEIDVESLNKLGERMTQLCETVIKNRGFWGGVKTSLRLLIRPRVGSARHKARIPHYNSAKPRKPKKVEEAGVTHKKD
ncbi:hypothetical protein Trydic_g3543 [Trypoxylus dichotomus]